MARVFISYARRDARDLALRLCGDVGGKHVAWLDTAEIDGGASWSLAIEQAIDSCDVLLALLSPAAAASAICRGEQLRAIRKGKRVIPVLATPRADVPIHLEAANYRDLSTPESYPPGLRDLLEELEHWRALKLPALWRPGAVRRPAPPPGVSTLVSRPDDIDRLWQLATREGPLSSIGITVLQGAPGGGKTTLAVELCGDERVKDAFPDGIVWVSLGPERMEMLPAIATVLEAVGDEAPQAYRAELDLRAALQQKSALIVLDDAWRLEQLSPFLVGSARSRIVVTTRIASLAAEIGAAEYHLADLSLEQALEMLRAWSRREDDPAFPRIAERLHHHALALRVAGAQLRGGGSGDDWLARLHSVGQLFTSASSRGKRELDVMACLDVSVGSLAPAERPLIDVLAVFPPDTPIPRPLVERLWASRRSAELPSPQHVLMRFEELGLLEPVGDDVRMHGLIVEYAAERLRHSGHELAAAHGWLLESVAPNGGPWSAVEAPPSFAGYWYEHLGRHLLGARGYGGLAQLLAEEDDQGRNRWHQRRDELGEALGYLADVQLAWRAVDGGAPNELSRAARCALLASSVRSRSANAPPALIRAFVQRGIWDARRAGDFALQLADPFERLAALLEAAAAPRADRLKLLEAAHAAWSSIEHDRRRIKRGTWRERSTRRGPPRARSVCSWTTSIPPTGWPRCCPPSRTRKAGPRSTRPWRSSATTSAHGSWDAPPAPSERRRWWSGPAGRSTRFRT